LPEFASLGESVLVAKELGLDFVELNAEVPFCLPQNLKKADIESGLSFTVHLFEAAEVGLLYEPARKAQIEVLKRIMTEYKAEANIKRFTLHINEGAFSTMPDKTKIYVFERFERDYLDACRKSFKELSDFAAKNDLEICFENVKVSEYAFKAFAELTKYPNLNYTFDAGHDVLWAGGRAFCEFLKSPEKIRHVHLHDVVNGVDHQELGQGKVDVAKILDFCKANNTDIVLEVRREEQLRNSLDYLRKSL